MMTPFDQVMQAAPALDEWQAQLGPLRIGPGTPYDFTTLYGVDELPELRTDDEARPWAHGDWSGTDFAGGRLIAWTLDVDAPRAEFDAALAALRAVMVPQAGLGLVPMWFNLPRLGGMVRWSVKVRRHRINMDRAWLRAEGATQEAQLYAPDPVGYGPGRSVSTGFASETGGLEFDLFTDGSADTGWLEFGAGGSSGRVTLTNAGTAPSWPVHRIAGPTPESGFEIVDVASGKRLRFVGAVPAGSHLLIDTATGAATLDDVADRSSLLVMREWTPVLAGGDATLAFLPLGPVSTPSWEPGAALRRNLVIDPRATDATKWLVSFGTHAGTETQVTGASDGPLLPDGTRASTYMRYTWTTENTSGTPLAAYSTLAAPPVGLGIGARFGAAIYARVSEPVPSIFGYISQRVAGADSDNIDGPTQAGSAAGEWQRVEWTGVTTVNADGINSVGVGLPGMRMPVGATLDVTCAMFEPGATVVGPYFDGSTQDSATGVYEWDGAPNASSSTQYAPAHTPQATLTVAHADAWW